MTELYAEFMNDSLHYVMYLYKFDINRTELLA